jgi:hypothetical protein
MTEQTPSAEDVLVEIRDELRSIRALLEQQGVCPHGNTGVCMYCILPTLTGIEMAVREAVKPRGY